MTDGVVAFDHAGYLIHCNPAANNLLQRKVEPDCTYEELLGDMHPFEEVLALQRPNYVEEELKVGERTLDVSRPFSDHEQGGVLIVLHDMTEQHRNEERRKEFVANVSHELRTPSPMSAATQRLCGTLLATFRRRPLTTFWILSLQRRTG